MRRSSEEGCGMTSKNDTLNVRVFLTVFGGSTAGELLEHFDERRRVPVAEPVGHIADRERMIF